MRKSKSNLSAGLMMEAWREDGVTIGKLRLANRYLAERLAGLGLHPEDDVEADMPEGCDVDGLAREWIQAADIDAAMAYEQGRVRA